MAKGVYGEARGFQVNPVHAILENTEAGRLNQALPSGKDQLLKNSPAECYARILSMDAPSRFSGPRRPLAPTAVSIVL